MIYNALRNYFYCNFIYLLHVSILYTNINNLDIIFYRQRFLICNKIFKCSYYNYMLIDIQYYQALFILRRVDSFRYRSLFCETFTLKFYFFVQTFHTYNMTPKSPYYKYLFIYIQCYQILFLLLRVETFSSISLFCISFNLDILFYHPNF